MSGCWRSGAKRSRNQHVAEKSTYAPLRPPVPGPAPQISKPWPGRKAKQTTGPLTVSHRLTAPHRRHPDMATEDQPHARGVFLLEGGRDSADGHREDAPW